jgi:signal transduction histidine kinase
MPPLSQRIQALLSAPDRLLWAVRVRWLTIGGFLFLAVVAHGFGLFESITPIWQVAVWGGALNAVNGWCIRHRRYVFTVSAIAIPLDHVFTTYLVVNSGGAQSPFLVLYAVQVLATAMLVDRLVAAASAALAMVLWFVAVSWQAAGALAGAALFPAGAAGVTSAYHATVAAFLFYCLALLVYLGGYIAERLRASERDLEKQNARLQDVLASERAAHVALTAAYDRLQRTEAHLIQSEKMRSLGQLVAGVAHELNNPISFVSANVEHVRAYVERLRQALESYAQAPLPADHRARIEGLCRALRIDQISADLPGLLDDCEEGARRTKQIVKELQTFSRRDEREVWRPTALHRSIDSTLGILSHRLKDRIAVHREFAKLPDVECHPGQLNQVFMNLLTNATDAIGDRRGSIWITTRLLPGAACPGGTAPSVTISIRDDGPGIPAELQARIFEPFFTTKEVGQGTGLGLSVSYGIVERHGGTLAVESAPGRGSTFVVTLPVKQPRVGRAPSQLDSTANIKRIAQSVAEQGETQHRQHQGQPWEECHMRSDQQEGASLVDHRTPRRGRGLHAEPEEAQACFGHDGARHSERRLHDERGEELRHNVLADDPHR